MRTSSVPAQAGREGSFRVAWLGGAAAGAIAGLAASGQASVIYQSVDPVNGTVDAGHTSYGVNLSGGSKADVDIDLKAYQGTNRNISVADGSNSANPNYVAVSNSDPLVKALSIGDVVGTSSQVFDAPNGMLIDTDATGQFPPEAGEKYIGIRLDPTKTGAYHYGWIGYQTLTASPDVSGQVVEFAYETSPNTPITIVPEPSSLALLALGASGLAAYRRRQA